MSLLSYIYPRKPDDYRLGISFHDDGISVARVRRDKAGQVLLNLCEFMPLENDCSHADLLADLTSRHKLDKSHCVCIMMPGKYSLMHMEAPDVPTEELRSAVRWRIKDQIDFHIDDAIVDVFDIPGQTGRGGPKMMYVVAALQREVQWHVDLLHDAGLIIDAIDITELAFRNIISLLPQDEHGSMLLTLDRISGLISLSRQSILYLSRGISIGSDQLRKYAGIGERGEMDISPEMESLLGSLVLELQRSLDYHESHTTTAPIKHLVVMPIEHPVENLSAYLGNEFHLPVTMIDFNEQLDCSDVIPLSVQARCSAAVGGALRIEAASL